MRFLTMRFRKNNNLAKIVNDIIWDLGTPQNINLFWNFGSLLGVILSVQLITGIFLALQYTANSDISFFIISRLLRDVNGGWLLRYIHANGASFFFICIYLHIGRGIYYSAYLRKSVWFIGIVLLILVIAAAFLGYVLPWGQISFWGATVITNLFSAFPYIGADLVIWLWGGYSVDNPTLTRFFSFHYLVPFILSGATVIHLFFLHSVGSNNPLSIPSYAEKVTFHWYFTIKDMFGFLVLFFFLFSLALFNPDYLGEPDNFIQANPMVTPVHIVPEWYFLFAYAILRSIPNKLGGVIGLFRSLLILATLPYTHKHKFKGLVWYPLSKLLFWLYCVSFFLLTIGGAWPVEEPFVAVSQFWSTVYFSFFVLLNPSCKLSDYLYFG